MSSLQIMIELDTQIPLPIADMIKRIDECIIVTEKLLLELDEFLGE